MYFASFDMSGSAEGLGSITIAASGETNAVLDISTLSGTTAAGSNTTTVRNHYSTAPLSDTVSPGRTDISPLSTSWVGQTLSSELTTWIRSGEGTNDLTTLGWATPSGFSVSFNVSTGKYTFSYSVQNFTLSFSNTATADFFGYSGTQSGSSSYVSDQVADYVISPTLDAASDFSGMAAIDYEPQAPASVAASDAGNVYAIARSTEHVYRDWYQQFETKAKAIRKSAVAAHPMTFQKLFEVCRDKPFVVKDGFGEADDEVFQFRTEGTQWNPQRATPGNDNQFHVPFQCHVIGKLVEPG